MNISKTKIRDLGYLVLSWGHDFYLSFTKSKLRVLAYHDVLDSRTFEKQINFLNSHYSIISIEQLKNHLINNANLPDKPLLITFDDGDVSVFEKGLPVLKKFGLPSVLFVITGLIDTARPFWWRQIEYCFKRKGLSYNEARRKVNWSKRVSNEKRKKYIESLGDYSQEQLTLDQLIISRNQQMFIANHTASHPMLDKCSEQEIHEEFREANAKFTHWKLDGYSVFAYPNGNWSKETEDVLVKRGIEMAFLFDHSLNSSQMHPLRISRIAVDSDLKLPEFKAKVSGLHPMLLRLKKM